MKHITAQILFGVLAVMALSACVRVHEEMWTESIRSARWDQDGKPVVFVRKPWGRKYVGSGAGAGPIPTGVDVYPEYYDTKVYHADEPVSVFKKTNWNIIYPIGKDRIIGSYPASQDASFYYLEHTGNQPELLISFPRKGKLDFTFSKTGNYLAWGESDGLSVMDTRTKQINKYLAGIPVRKPVFADDENRIGFYVWVDTTAAKRINAESLNLSKVEVRHSKYDRVLNKKLRLDSTVEYAGVVLYNLKQNRVSASYPKIDILCPNIYTFQDICLNYFADATFLSKPPEDIKDDIVKSYLIDAYSDVISFGYCSGGCVYSPDLNFFGFKISSDSVYWYDSATKKEVGVYSLNKTKH